MSRGAAAARGGGGRAPRNDREKAPPRPPAPLRSQSLWPRIYAVVARIPRGRVATYGQVAALAGLPRQARLVGYALHGLPDGSRLPWHRVINAQGRVSPRSDERPSEGLQRHLLEEEGVLFDLRGNVDLRRYRWRPRSRPLPGVKPTPPAGRMRRRPP